MIQLRVLEAALVGRGGQREEGLIPAGELVEGGAVHPSIVSESLGARIRASPAVERDAGCETRGRARYA